MINPRWRRFLSRKRFEVVFESKRCGFVMRIESGRRKIINHGFEQGQGNPPSCQRFATSTTRQASSWTANLWHSGGFPCPCTKPWYFLIVPPPKCWYLHHFVSVEKYFMFYVLLITGLVVITEAYIIYTLRFEIKMDMDILMILKDKSLQTGLTYF